jgi:hypothetical protein
MIFADYSFGDAIWTMIVFFAFVIWIWMMVTIFSDLFRRHDTSGWAKAAWTVLIIFLPLVGVLAYLISQGKHMAERRVAEVEATQAAFDDHIRTVSSGGGSGAAGEISQAKQLLDSGAITPAEFDRIKGHALGNGATTPAYTAD